MSGAGQTLYLKLDQNSLVREPAVRLEDVAEAECADAGILRKVKALEIYRFHCGDSRWFTDRNKRNKTAGGGSVNRGTDGGDPGTHSAVSKEKGAKTTEHAKGKGASGKARTGGRVQVISVLDVIEEIHKIYPALEIVSLGAPDFVVRYEPVREKSGAQLAKTAFLCVVLFFGSAFTIMTFIQDVSVGEVFDRFYMRVTGADPMGVTPLEIGFCIGLAFGIIFFYNHIGRKKITDDPTPIQVQMRKYEQDVDNTYIENSGRKGKEIDADN
ncbi:MAG: stage V sporulation protein AA [Lachnospiraceae bacterium]|nr:stage V sporulation protein AA [Lachnospiraceae bacterium]